MGTLYLLLNTLIALIVAFDINTGGFIGKRVCAHYLALLLETGCSDCLICYRKAPDAECHIDE